jgi:hypothetical protein
MLNKPTQHYLHELDNMQKIIFSFYIKRNFGEDRFFHEKRLLKQTSKIMRAMKKVRDSLLDSKTISYLEPLYEIIFSLDLLKDRLIDHATFEICEQELKNISHGLSAFFVALKKSQVADTKMKFDNAIQALEIIFQNTLQVVAADPMVFLFFIKDLYALSNSLDRVTLLN